MATNSIPVRLSDELLAKLDEIAKQQRRSRSQLLRVLFEDAVAAYEAKNGVITLPAKPS